MDENEVREIIQKHAERQFPRTCPCCGVAFNSLAEYYESTTRLGDPIPYDAEIDNWEPEKSLGTVFFVNCKCLNTLSLSSKGGEPFDPETNDAVVPSGNQETWCQHE